MNFACERCDRRYEISDEKVGGRSFKVTCRGCGHAIVVRAAAPVPPAAPSARGVPPPPVPAAAPSARGVAPPPVPPMLRRAPLSSPGVAAAPVASAGAAVVPSRAPAAAPALPRAPVAPWPASAKATSLAEALPAPAPPAAVPARPAASVPARPRPLHLVADAAPPAEEHRFFSAAQLSQLPGVTAEWLLANRRRHPRFLPVVLGLLGLAVCGGVALSRWRAAEGIPAIPDPPTTTRQRLLAAAPPPAIEPAPLQVRGGPSRREGGVQAAAPLPADGPLEARGGPAHAVGPGPGADEALRARIRRRQLTIARSDRRLLDLLVRKGDAAVAAPGGAAELDTGQGALAPAAVRRIMRGSAGGYSSCVTRALKLEPRLRVDGRRITLDLTVRPSGIVGDARLEAPDLARTGLARCLLETARRMVFPAFDGGPTEVSVPLALSAVQ